MNNAPLPVLEYHFHEILRELGCDLDSEGMAETPLRYAKFLKSFLHKEPINFTMFDANGMDEMILEVGIPFASLCEHHCLPFSGTASIAYIPNRNIAGLSKLPRALNYFCAGFQTQERITQQTADYLHEMLDPRGVAVQLVGEHSCMTIRGVKAHGTKTITNFLTGCFKDDPACRAEFFATVNSRKS